MTSNRQNNPYSPVLQEQIHQINPSSLSDPDNWNVIIGMNPQPLFGELDHATRRFSGQKQLIAEGIKNLLLKVPKSYTTLPDAKTWYTVDVRDNGSGQEYIFGYVPRTQRFYGAKATRIPNYYEYIYTPPPSYGGGRTGKKRSSKKKLKKGSKKSSKKHSSKKHSKRRSKKHSSKKRMSRKK